MFISVVGIKNVVKKFIFRMFINTKEGVLNIQDEYKRACNNGNSIGKIYANVLSTSRVATCCIAYKSHEVFRLIWGKSKFNFIMHFKFLGLRMPNKSQFRNF